MRVLYHPKVYKVIRNLSENDNSRVIKVIDFFITYGFNLSELHLKKITRRVWELRAGRYRLLFGLIRSGIIITSIYYKKTQKTPKKVIKLSIQRLNEYEKQD